MTTLANAATAAAPDETAAAALCLASLAPRTPPLSLSHSVSHSHSHSHSRSRSPSPAPGAAPEVAGVPVPADVLAAIAARGISGAEGDAQRLVLRPVHPGTVGRGRTSCVHHRSVKKRWYAVFFRFRHSP